jgi:hypothetical protein
MGHGAAVGALSSSESAVNYDRGVLADMELIEIRLFLIWDWLATP